MSCQHTDAAIDTCDREHKNIADCSDRLAVVMDERHCAVALESVGMTWLLAIDSLPTDSKTADDEESDDIVGSFAVVVANSAASFPVPSLFVLVLLKASSLQLPVSASPVPV